MAKENPYLDVQNLTKSFGALVLFRDLCFSIAEGQKVGLIAKNGTGKSTLLSILSGKEGYDSGSIVFRRELKVGMLEQSPAFDPDESVLDACFNHQGEDEKVLKAKQVLTQLKIRDLNQRMGELSGGQQKRVALANVLLTEPDLLILDEPTNHLDFGNQMRTIMKIKDLASKGYAVIMTTHMPNHAIMLQGKTAILNRSGELICGETEQIVTDENLRDIYQVDVRVVDVAEAGGKLCVFAQNQLR